MKQTFVTAVLIFALTALPSFVLSTRWQAAPQPVVDYRPPAAVEVPPLSTREIVRRAAHHEAGWGEGAQWRCLQAIVDIETGHTWLITAQNPESTAYGLYGFLNSTWGPTGVRKTSSAWWQTIAAVRYTQQREGYRTPCRALRFHQQNGYW